MGKYRIKEYDGKGWIVEYKKSVWGFFGLVHRWRHVTHYMGLESTPYYYSTPEEARDGALVGVMIWAVALTLMDETGGEKWA